LRPTILLARDRSESLEITMSAEHSDTHHARELLWHAWQQRGLARDARHRQYMLAVASIAALTLAGWLSIFGPA
jgi:hypothetical protein